MRYLFTSMLFVFVAATTLSATEETPANASVSDVVPSVVTSDAPAPTAGMHLDRIAVEERAAKDDAAAAQFAQRGSFWWLVGVVVVAGIILAVVL